MSKRCPKCGKKYEANFSLCEKDGAALVIDPADRPHPVVPPTPPNQPGPHVAGNRWARRQGEFAARLDSTDLKALINKGIVVDEGTQGLFFQSGRMVACLSPGYHTLETLTERFKNLVFGTPVAVVLIDVSQTVFGVKTTLMHTSDSQTVDCEAQIVVAVNSPVDFYTNVMKGRSIVMVDEIAKTTAAWVQETLEPIVLRSRADELYGNPEIRERVELDLFELLKPRMQRQGLRLVGVDHLRIENHVDSEIRRKRGELNRTEALAEIEFHYRAFREKLASVETEEKMRKLQSDAEFAEFVKDLEHQAFRREVLSRQDRDEIIRQYNQRKQDIHAAREHLLATMELKRGEEIAHLKHDMDVAQLRRDYQLELERLKNRGTLSAEGRRQEQQRLDEEIAGHLRRSDAELEQKLESERKLFEAKIAQRRESAQVDLDIEARKRKELLEQARDSVEVYLDYKKGKQEIEHSDRKLEFDLGQREAAGKHREKLETATAFNGLSVTALIAMAPPEQAALLADLQKTETLRGMTEQQILALYAKDSPEIAKALAEKFKAAGASEAEAKEKSEKLVERILSEKDAWVKTVVEMHRDGIQAVKDIAQSAMNSQRDTARNAATPVFVQSGSPHYPYAPPPPQPFICTACRNASPPGSPFCHHCGHRT